MQQVCSSYAGNEDQESAIEQVEAERKENQSQVQTHLTMSHPGILKNVTRPASGGTRL